MASGLSRQFIKREEVIYLPQTVFAEVGYMLGREFGNRGFADFLRRLPETKYRILALKCRIFCVQPRYLEQYADSRVDFVDASDCGSCRTAEDHADTHT